MPKLYTVELQGGAHGHLEAGHLADHPSAVAALQAVVKPGLPLGPLLVLERLEVQLLCIPLCHPLLTEEDEHYCDVLRSCSGAQSMALRTTIACSVYGLNIPTVLHCPLWNADA